MTRLAFFDSTKPFKCGCRVDDNFVPVDLCTEGMELWLAFRIVWNRCEAGGKSPLWSWITEEGKAINKHFSPDNQTEEGQRNYPL